MRVVWSPLALDRAARCVDYISRDNPLAAERWVNQLFERVNLLAITPYMGRLVPELRGQKYREIILGNYRVIYSVDEAVNVLTIRGTRQDLHEERL